MSGLEAPGQMHVRFKRPFSDMICIVLKQLECHRTVDARLASMGG